VVVIRNKETYSTYVCGTVKKSCADYMKVDDNQPYNSVRKKFSDSLQSWNQDQLQTLGYMEAREVPADVEGTCFVDGCIMPADVKKNYKLSSCGSLQQLDDGSCFIGMNMNNDVNTLGKFLTYAHNSKFSEQVVEKTKLEENSEQLKNTINNQTATIISQNNQILNIDNTTRAAKASAEQDKKQNTIMQSQISDLNKEYNREWNANFKHTSRYSAAVSTDVHVNVRIGSEQSPVYLMKAITQPNGDKKYMYLAYKYAAQTSFDPFSFWMGRNGLDFNIDSIKDPRFVSNSLSYRCDKFINPLASPSVQKTFMIAVQINQGAASRTLFFTHRPSDGSNADQNLTRWFSSTTLLNGTEHSMLGVGRSYKDFSIAGTALGGTSRWAIVDAQGKYILAVPVATSSGAWESRARGIPIFVNNNSLSPAEMSRLSDKQILDMYGCDNICVYVRQIDDDEYFGRIFTLLQSS